MSHHVFIIGHVLEILRDMPDESVHCVVTSPPYLGLRDYGLSPAFWPEVEYVPMPGLPPIDIPAWEGQLGLEPTPEMYVAHLILVFREVRRVLRKDGTIWLNLGDTYAAGGNGGHQPSATFHGHNGRRCLTSPRIAPNCLKQKDLVGIPWRVAFALQADGWWLRSDIIWAKPNPLPESVKDRPSKAHEYVFLLTKSEKYFYDAEAIKEEATTHFYDKRYGPGGSRDRSNEPWNSKGPLKPHSGFKTLDTTKGRNKRSVWWIPTEPFPESHFAVFPQALVRPCIKAGTSEYGCCPECGAPWERVTERVRQPRGDCFGKRQGALDHGQAGSPYMQVVSALTIGCRPTCSCGIEDTIPCVVLDPFGGAGTTTLTAMSLDRDSIYIDLKREYVEMALKRCGFKEGKLFDTHTFDVVDFSHNSSETLGIHLPGVECMPVPGNQSIISSQKKRSNLR